MFLKDIVVFLSALWGQRSYASNILSKPSTGAFYFEIRSVILFFYCLFICGGEAERDRDRGSEAASHCQPDARLKLMNHEM